MASVVLSDVLGSLPNWTAEPASLTVTDGVGYFADRLQVEIDVPPDSVQNPWEIERVGQLPRLLSITPTIEGTSFLPFYGRNASVGNTSGIPILNLQGQRVDSGAFADVRLRGAINTQLRDSVTQEAYAKHYSLQAPDYAARVTVLQQFGYIAHVGAGGGISIYPVESLWRADKRNAGPFQLVSLDVTDISEHPATFSLQDMRVRNDYDGAGLFAVVHAATGAISARITAAGGTYQFPSVGAVTAESLFPHRDVGGTWPNEDMATVRLQGELSRVRFEAEVGTAFIDLNARMAPGRIVRHSGANWVVIQSAHDITAGQTTLSLVRYVG